MQRSIGYTLIGNLWVYNADISREVWYALQHMSQGYILVDLVQSDRDLASTDIATLAPLMTCWAFPVPVHWFEDSPNVPFPSWSVQWDVESFDWRHSLRRAKQITCTLPTTVMFSVLLLEQAKARSQRTFKRSEYMLCHSVRLHRLDIDVADENAVDFVPMRLSCHVEM
jgi:hypothetical protein